MAGRVAVVLKSVVLLTKKKKLHSFPVMRFSYRLISRLLPAAAFLPLALALMAPTSCRPAKLPESAAAVLIEFQRTACMGPCPVDMLTVYADGRLRYEGQANAPRQGRYAARLAGPQQAELVRAFEEARFFEFAPAYKSRATDLPTYYLTYARADRRLKITDYDGAPPALKALEARLETLIETADWQRE